MNVKPKMASLWISVVVVLALVPAPALAGEPILDPPDSDITISGSSEGAEVHTFYLSTIACAKDDVSGTISAGGKSGTMVLDLTGCHLLSMGFTYPCHSASAPLSNTISFAGSFATTYVTDAKTKPGIKFTIPSTQIICGLQNAGIVTLSGSSLGTLSAPACGAESTKGTVNFKVVTAIPEAPQEEHRQITGTGPFVDWASTAGPESKSTAGLTVDLSLQFSKSIKVTCV